MPRLEDIPPDLIATSVSRAVVDAVARGGETEAIVLRALEGAKRSLGLADGPTSPPANPTARATALPPAPTPAPARPIVTEDDVLDAARSGDELRVPPGALVTPLARDTAKDRGVRLVEG